jgi:YggT family protein
MILNTFLSAIAEILHLIVGAYIWVVIIAAMISWINPDPRNPIVEMLHRVTDPVYAQMRRRFNTIYYGIDFAPLILIIALEFIDKFFIRLLISSLYVF